MDGWKEPFSCRKNWITIGPHGNVVSDIKAREVVIIGKVKGNILCGDRADIRSGCVVTGEIIARRVMVEDRAAIKGSVEVRAADQLARQQLT